MAKKVLIRVIIAGWRDANGVIHDAKEFPMWNENEARAYSRKLLRKHQEGCAYWFETDSVKTICGE